MYRGALAGVRRSAPVELIGFDGASARFVDATGGIAIGHDAGARQRWEA